MAQDEKLLSLKEAAALIRVHPNTIREWVKRGEVPCERYGAHRVIRVKLSDLRSAGDLQPKAGE